MSFRRGQFASVTRRNREKLRTHIKSTIHFCAGPAKRAKLRMPLYFWRVMNRLTSPARCWPWTEDGRQCDEKHQNPNTKHQKNSKLQTSKRRRRFTDGFLGFGIWRFFGVWILVFGVFSIMTLGYILLFT